MFFGHLLSFIGSILSENLHLHIDDELLLRYFLDEVNGKATGIVDIQVI